MQLKKNLIVYFVVSVGVISLVRTCYLLWNGEFLDFSIIYKAILVLISGQNPYTSDILLIQVNYPPQLLIMIAPLTMIGYDSAKHVWLLLSAGSLIGSLYLLYLIRPVALVMLSIIFTLALLSFPFKFTLGMGQVNHFVLFATCGALFALIKKKDILFGILYSSAIFLKIFPIAIIFIPLVSKKWKTVILSVLITCITTVIVSFFVSLSTFQYYVFHVLFPLIFTNSTGSYYYNQSLMSFFNRLEIYNGLYIALRIIGLSLVTYTIMRNKKDIFGGLSLLITSILVFSSLTWQHYFILLLIPFYYLLTQPRTRWNNLCIAVSYFLVAVNIANPLILGSSLLGNVMLSHGMFGSVLLWLVLIRKVGMQRHATQ